MLTKDPFHVEGPAIISFSGGRTSAYMLRCILTAEGGTLPPDVHVCFANTGKEMPETLDFVRDCGERWNVPIVWLEYDHTENGPTFRVVDHATASRNGEPFKKLIAAKNYLPNPVTRFCTQELKIRVMCDYARSVGFDHWTNIVGLRADEPRRVARMRASEKQWFEVDAPLATAGITVRDVAAFWRPRRTRCRPRPHPGAYGMARNGECADGWDAYPRQEAGGWYPCFMVGGWRLAEFPLARRAVPDRAHRLAPPPLPAAEVKP